MPVRIVLLTHREVGEALKEAAKNTLVQLPLRCDTISVSEDTDFDTLLLTLEAIADENLDDGGVLILTDLYGSTPCNLAKKLCASKQCEVVTGLNLAMLIRIMNYAKRPLAELSEIACEGGKQSILKIRKMTHD